MRLHELAKELGADSKKLLAIAKELSLGVKSHSSSIPKGAEGILRAAWAEELEIMAEEEAEKAAKKAKKEAKAKAAAAAEAGESAEAEVVAEVPAEAPAEEAPAAEDEPADAGAEDDKPITSIEITSPEEAERREAAEAERRAAEETARAEAEAAAQAEHEAAEAARAAAEAAEDAAAAAAAEAEAEAEEEPAAENTISLTIGGQEVGAEEDADADAPAAASADGDAPADETKAKAEVEVKGRPNVPESKPRRRAKILGKIDIKPKEDPGSSRAGGGGARTGGGRGPSQYDPLDPTRPPPARRGGGAGTGTGAGAGAGGRRAGGAGDAAAKSRQPGRPGRGEGEFVFDAEDTSALGAIRLGHFGNRRPPSRRRPPMRRQNMGGRRGGGRKRRGERPTHPVSVQAPIGVRELADVLGIKAREILMHFPDEFDPRDKNAVLGTEHLEVLAEKLERDITVLAEMTEEMKLLQAEEIRAMDMAGDPEPRGPIVAVMGHVDHGKTSLLDALRNSRVAAKEAGGITQKTSAYLVHDKNGNPVTFLDTPGHRAFTEMRARGAAITDVAVLVVAADDGVMEQTREAIEHAQAAEVPFIIAINKIDKSNANPDQVKQQLAQHGIMVEGWGGDVGVVECSATTGQGLDELVERLALETEILELDGDPAIPARGVVVDSHKDPNLGIVATCIILDGTLNAKDPVLVDTIVGRVRYMNDDAGKRVKTAGPGVPVQVFGFEEPPPAGAQFLVVKDINEARVVAAERKEEAREIDDSPTDTLTLDSLFEQIESKEVTEINVILKSDVFGSLEVVKQTVSDLAHPEVKFKVIRSGIGAITEDDVVLAQASEAIIIGFGVVPDKNARSAVQRTGVDVRFYDVIYAMTEDLEKALEGQLGTEEKETVTGHAEVRAVFKSSKLGNIAGCYVTDGIIRREARIRLVRDGKVMHTGKLDSLRRFTDDVKEVRESYECGMHLDRYDDIREGDVLEAYEVELIKRTLESSTTS